MGERGTQAGPRLPANRAFVVQFVQAEAGVEPFRGRVEQISSVENRRENRGLMSRIVRPQDAPPTEGHTTRSGNSLPTSPALHGATGARAPRWLRWGRWRALERGPA